MQQKGRCREERIKEQWALPLVKKYPFLNETVRDQTLVGNYKYLSIVTDGGINPNPNITNMVGRPRNNLIIEFDGGDIWKIDREKYNLNIERYNTLWFTNLNYSAAIGAHVQNGFFNLFLILSMERIDETFFRKHNPFVCEEDIRVAADGEANRWIGIFRPTPTWQLIMPWLPIGYDKITYEINQTDVTTDWQVTVNQYAKCSNNLISTIIDVNTFTLGTFEHICSNRFRINLINHHILKTAIFHYMITFLDKSND